MIGTSPVHLRRLAAAATILTALAASPPGTRAADPPFPTLHDVFRAGAFLQDKNGDGVIDFVAASLVLGAAPSLDEIAAASDVAARLGFETMALDLPLGRQRADGGIVAIGASGVQRAGLDPASLPFPALTAGQGLVAIATAGARPVVAILGGDGAGLRAAASAFAGRVPYVWIPKGETLEKLAGDVREALGRDGVTTPAVGVVAVRVNAGNDEFERVIVRATLPSPADLARARTGLRRLRPVAGSKPAAGSAVPAQGVNPVTDGSTSAPGAKPAANTQLSYPGARNIEVQLATAPTAQPERVVLPRIGLPPVADLPPGRRPGAGAKDNIDLSSLFSNDGLLGDSDNNLIPDRVDAIISPAGAATEGVIDLAGRIGLESTGVSLPLVIPADQLGKPESQPQVVLVGASHPVTAELIKSGKAVLPALAGGDGVIQIIRKAFGEKSAVVVSGADGPGLGRALQQVAERLPHVWERGKDRTTLDDIENDVRRFIAGRSPAGQAASALYKVNQLAGQLRNRPLESAQVRVYLEKADAGVEAVLRRELATTLPGTPVSVIVENLDVQKAKTIIDEDIEIPSEVDEFWQSLRTEVIPRLTKAQPVVIEARLSEPPEVRERLAKEATAELIKAGASAAGTSVVVLSAYKQGFSWLYDVVRPALAGKPVRDITIRFAETGAPPEWKQQAMFTPTRWLLEIFPIDEVLARELKLEQSQVRLEKMPIGSPIYEVIATGTNGAELLRQQFEPKMVLRSYFDRFPDYEKVRVTTGWINARSAGRVLADRRIVTDMERFWDHFQAKTLSPMYDYVMALSDGKPRPEHAPFFGELTVDVTLSEPNYMLGIDKEQIAALNSLHEDVYFATLHFFDVMGRYTRGAALQYPGRVIPIMRPKGDGRSGRAKIKLTGFGSSRPAVAIDYVEKGGAKGTLKLDVPRVNVDRPSAMAAVVRAGQNGLESLSLRLKVDTDRDERVALLVRARTERVDEQIMSAEQAGAMIGYLATLRAAGAYRDALAYHNVRTIALTTHWTYDAPPKAEQTFMLPANGTAAPFPDIRRLLPSGYRYAGGPMVQWDTPIPPPEAYELLAKMSSSFKEATAYKVGESYLGKDVWAMDLMPPLQASHWSAAKATTMKPTVVYSARQHANEVSSTSHTLKMAELLLTDPQWRAALNRVNVVFHPITNPDGAQLAYDLYKITPDYMLHAGYLGSLGVDVTNGQWEQDPVYPESTIRADIWRDWLPDIFLNPHGYPSHEWVMVFSEYAGWVRNRVTEARDWWGMRGWFTPGFGFIDDPKYPRHKDAAFRIRELFSRAVNAPADVRALNERAYARYRRYGDAFDPENFKVDFTNDVLIYSAIKGSKGSPTSNDFMARNPNVTIWTGSTEAPDETAHGDWMKLVATAGLEWDKSILQYLLEGDHQIERKEEAFYGGVTLSIHRPRPPKPRDEKKTETTANPGGAPK